MDRTTASIDVHLGDEAVTAHKSGSSCWIRLGWAGAVHVRTPEQVERLRSALDDLADLMAAPRNGERGGDAVPTDDDLDEWTTQQEALAS